jgi:hypothetical protein
MSYFTNVLDAISESFSARLPLHGFSADWTLEKSGVFRRWWFRDLGWKQDCVELVYGRGDNRIHLCLQVHLPKKSWENCVRTQEDKDYDYAPIADIAAIGIHTLHVYQPLFLREWRLRRYVARITGVLVEKLPWFDEYNSPTKCLEWLHYRCRQSEKPTSNFMTARMKYLEGCIREENSGTLTKEVEA